RNAFGFGNLVEIGHMPELLCLLGDRRDEMRKRMAQCVHGDARSKIEIAFAVLGHEPYAFAPLEGEVDTRKGRHQMRCHGTVREAHQALTRAADTNRAAEPGVPR